MASMTLFAYCVLTLCGLLEAQVVQLGWTTNFDNLPGEHQIGRNGPWQALSLTVGAESGFTVDVWPTDGSMVYIVANTTKGDNAIERSPSSHKLPFFSKPDWSVYNTTSWSYGYEEHIAISTHTSRPISFNYSLAVINDSTITLSNGHDYTNNVGVLGLGPQPVNSPDSGDPITGKPTLLEQLKASGTILSASFGMHMGSVQHKQPGSLILGGYEQNRVLGDVGIFDIDDSGSPHIFLLDVILDTQVGHSPFNNARIGSVFKGFDDNSYEANVTKLLGGTQSSALVRPVPSVPYIYLPPGTCETASQYLPVTWNDNLGLYLWNQNDTQYIKIVDSPAYMGFILADRTASNITIKVPFSLLNLMLEPPLVDEPVPYFPCKALPPSPNQVFCPLGRAFLQAAFWGVNFDTQKIFIAQAPGPEMNLSVIKTLKSDDTSILSNPISTFEKSWSRHWKVADSKTGLSKTAIAGTVAGSIVVGLLIAVTASWAWRGRRVRQTRYSEDTAELLEPLNGDVGSSGSLYELEASPQTLDKSDPMPHELMVPVVVHEAPGDSIASCKQASSPREEV
ncbi:aspartic peptidase domain-containing protein [Astrocystis sublimbata]|nr:aspartic peptidase domain-containing protein [Astrocystis sublimbata]